MAETLLQRLFLGISSGDPFVCVCVCFFLCFFFCSSTKEIKTTEVYMCLQGCDISLVALCYVLMILLIVVHSNI